MIVVQDIYGKIIYINPLEVCYVEIITGKRRKDGEKESNIGIISLVNKKVIKIYLHENNAQNMDEISSHVDNAILRLKT